MEPHEVDPIIPTRSRATRRSPRRRRLLAGALAVLGAGAIALAVTGDDGGVDVPQARTGGSLTGVDPIPGTTGSGPAEGPDTTTETGSGGQEIKAASDRPGGVGSDPLKTGLPAKAPEGSAVRTGTEAEGCFPDLRSYLDEWHRTNQEPEPCFTEQPPSEQPQPANVRRSYNGEKF